MAVWDGRIRDLSETNVGSRAWDSREGAISPTTMGLSQYQYKVYWRGGRAEIRGFPRVNSLIPHSGLASSRPA